MAICCLLQKIRSDLGRFLLKEVALALRYEYLPFPFQKGNRHLKDLTRMHLEMLLPYNPVCGSPVNSLEYFLCNHFCLIVVLKVVQFSACCLFHGFESSLLICFKCYQCTMHSRFYSLPNFCKASCTTILFRWLG